MARQYIVWIRETDTWEPNGDGPMGEKTAERVAREIEHDCHIPTRVFPVGVECCQSERKVKE